jgi:hypothetical protein
MCFLSFILYWFSRQIQVSLPGGEQLRGSCDNNDKCEEIENLLEFRGINQILPQLFCFPHRAIKNCLRKGRDDACNSTTPPSSYHRLMFLPPTCFNIQRKTSKFFHYFDSTLIFICLPCTRGLVNWKQGASRGSGFEVRLHGVFCTHKLDTRSFSTEHRRQWNEGGSIVIESIVDELHFSRFISLFQTSMA